LLKSRSDFQDAVGAFSASMAPAALRAPSKPGSPHGSGLGVFRWVVERILAWLHLFRRLALRDERRADVRTLREVPLACPMVERVLYQPPRAENVTTSRHPQAKPPK